MKRFLLIFLLFAFCVLSLIGCSKKQTKSDFLEKKCLCINFTQDPSTLDPRKNADYVSSTIHFLLYEGLLTLSEDGKPIPGIAKSYTLSDNGLVYTFHLRDAHWSNGDKITAQDFEQTWKDMLSPDFPCPNAHLLYPIKNAKKVKRGLLPIRALGIRSIDEKTFQVELEQSTPYFLNLITFCVFSPVNHHIVQKNPGWADSIGEDFTTNGPYKIASWKRDSELRLEKNPHYWNEKAIKLESIQISVINNENTALHMFEKKQLDILGLPFTSIPYDAVQSLKNKGAIQTHPTAASTVCFFNTTQFPFHNTNIRKAFAYAIDRQKIINNITQLDENPGLDFVPPALKNLNSYTFFSDNDIDRAKKHLNIGLSELGITKEDLNDLVYMHATSDESAKIAQALQEQWRTTLGVSIKLKGFEYKIFMNKLVSRDYQFAQSRWVAQYTDQMNIVERFMHAEAPKNYCGWYSKKYNNLVKESTKHQDETQRFAILKEAEQVLAEEMPFTVLYHWNSTYLKQPYLKDLKIYPSGGFFIQGISFEEAKINS